METTDQDHTPPNIAPTVENERANNLLKLGLVMGFLLVVSIVVGIVYFLLLDTTPTSTIRDILIIFMAFELAVIGITVILLIIQAARLVNLMQNEIRPLLEAANETMGTLRGTAVFLGDSFVQPVIKANSYLAGFRRILDLLNINIK